MTTRYKADMTPEKLMDLAFEISTEYILELVSMGTIQATAKDFAELHNYMDANCLGGFCDGDLQPVFEAIFKRDGDDDMEWFSDRFVSATNTVQNRVDAWIKEGGINATYE